MNIKTENFFVYLVILIILGSSVLLKSCKDNSYLLPFAADNFTGIYLNFGKNIRALTIQYIPRTGKGTVFKVKEQKPIFSIASGEISHKGNSRSRGNFIIINTDRNLEITYYHLNQVSKNIGDKIEKGETIGTSGRTGITTINCLGIQIRREGTLIDPEIFFEKYVSGYNNLFREGKILN